MESTHAQMVASAADCSSLQQRLASCYVQFWALNYLQTPRRVVGTIEESWMQDWSNSTAIA